NITISCVAANSLTGTSISYTNGDAGVCEISGSVTGQLSGSHDECGGSYTETWTFTDNCGRTISHSGTISVDPAPQAQFAATSNITISCVAANSLTGSSLSYTNGDAGVCEITGTTTGSLSGSHDECGGSYTETWTFTDNCGRTSTQSRTITVSPAPQASFTQLPGNITISCVAANSLTGTSISYTNGDAGVCEISGSVTGQLSGSHDECGGSYTETWTFTDNCGRTISHGRTIRVVPAPQAQFDPVSDISISCDVIPTPSSLAYTNGDGGICLISGSVTGTITGSYVTCGDSYT